MRSTGESVDRARGAPGSRSAEWSIGVDLVAVARIERLAAELPDLLPRIFTPGELIRSDGRRRPADRLAARFAAKEATLKALGTGLVGSMCWTDVEVVNEPSGRPRIRLDGAVAARARQAGIRRLDVSLSHTAGLALAQVLAVADARAPDDAERLAEALPGEQDGTDREVERCASI